jgi:hypothetical protein
MSNEVDVWAKLVELHPELTDADFDPSNGTIALQNDSDGFGTYIAKWEHPSIEQPTDEALGITRKPVVIDVVPEVVEEAATEALVFVEMPTPPEDPMAAMIEPPAPVIEEPTA